jgi:hypothetical protein
MGILPPWRGRFLHTRQQSKHSVSCMVDLKAGRAGKERPCAGVATDLTHLYCLAVRVPKSASPTHTRVFIPPSYTLRNNQRGIF